ncbi:MAG TPA: type II secretion system F family protein, partial [Candidatus Omnitrophota bacterium]|nr:type II secretion system F family protein [Candidatus Omnitrophota bacterium]
MPKFSYTVKDKTGKTIKETVESPSRDALVAKLQQQDFFIVNVEFVPQKGLGKNLRRKPKKFKYKKIKLQDLLTFSRQLATMLESGVPLIRSISVIHTQIQSEKFSEVVNDVLKNVEQGGSLSSALATHPQVFSQFWISLIEVGEASGTIPTTLDKLAFYLEQEASFKSTVISGIIYPSILFGVAVGAISFFALVVGPKFQSIFESMNAELPWITSTLLSLFAAIKKNILLIIGSIVGGVFALKQFIKTPGGRLMFEKFMFNLPTVGEVYKLIIIERFS